MNLDRAESNGTLLGEPPTRDFAAVRIESVGGWTIVTSELWHKTAQEMQTDLIDRVSSLNLEEDCYLNHTREGIRFLLRIQPATKTILLATDGALMERSRLRLLKELEKEGHLNSGQEQSLRDLQDFLSEFPEEGLCVGELEHVIQSLRPKGYPSETDKRIVQRSAEILKSLVLPAMQKSRPDIRERSMRNSLVFLGRMPALQNELLQFVVVLPTLNFDTSGKEVYKHLCETLQKLRRILRDSTKQIPHRALLSFLVSLGSVTSKILPNRLLAPLIRSLIRFTGRSFIAGQSIEDCENAIRKLEKRNKYCTVDQLGELVVSAAEADEYCERVRNTIEYLGSRPGAGETNAAGLPRAHVSIKVSALASYCSGDDPDQSYKQIAPRLASILELAKRHNVFVNADAEHYPLRDLVPQILFRLLRERPDLRQNATNLDSSSNSAADPPSDLHSTTYSNSNLSASSVSDSHSDSGSSSSSNVNLSADSPSDPDWSSDSKPASGSPDLKSIPVPIIGVVVQAYLKDAITHIEELAAEARELSIRLPIRLVKGAYWDEETAVFAAQQNEIPQFQIKQATDGNFRLMMEKILSCPELQLTVASHNVGDHCYALALREIRFPERPIIEHQFLFRTYDALSDGLASMGVPVRDYIPCGDIIVGMSYLVRRLLENSSQTGFLTAAATDPGKLTFQDAIQSYIQTRTDQNRMRLPSPGSFQPANHVEFFRPETRERFQSSSVTYPAPAFESPLDRLDEWCEDPQSENDPFAQSGRVRILAFWKVAELLLRDRLQIARVISHEARKTSSEAVGDVNEAIDFIRYYCLQQEAFEQESLKKHKSAPGFRPRGIFAVICPWNFPLAIPCGMATAAVLTGNRVLFKPAEQTMHIGAMFVDYCRQAEISEHSLSLIQGDGSTGAALVEHPEVGNVVFTGSKTVGNLIMERVRSRTAKKGTLARVITEMGGKNAILVTASADFDEAVAGVLYATLAHAGQKCSAASRLIIDERVATAFLVRLGNAMQDVIIGEPKEFSTLVNPLVQPVEKDRVMQFLREARQECEEYGGKVLVDRSEESEAPGLVGPVLMTLPSHRFLDQESCSRKEAFAPILHATTYQSLEEGLDLLHATEYGLTAGIFSQSAQDISTFLASARAGNLYVNRPNTGARVAIEPFGGFFQSGTGPKTGGPGYLPAFRALASESERQPVTSHLTKQGQSIQEWKEQFHSELQQALAGVTHYEIPGQWNYDSVEVVKSRIAIVINGSLSLAGILRLIAGSLLGSRQEILALSEEAYKAGIALEELCGEHLEPKRYTVRKTSPSEVARLLVGSNYDHVFVAADLDTTRSILNNTLVSEKGSTRITSLATVHDGLDDSPESILQELVYTRSIAINTLRHGANLDLGYSVKGVKY